PRRPPAGRLAGTAPAVGAAHLPAHPTAHRAPRRTARPTAGPAGHPAGGRAAHRRAGGPDGRARRRRVRSGRGPVRGTGMLLLRPPGVYRPQSDTRLLAAALSRAGIPRGARMLELGTGTGAVAMTAARGG